MTRRTVGNGEPTSSHPFVLGSRETQNNTGHFRSGDLGKRRTWVIFVLGTWKTQKNTLGIWENAEEHGSFSLWGSGKTQKKRVIFFLRIWENTEEDGSFSFWGSGKTQRNRGHFRSGIRGNVEEQGSFSFWAIPKRREVDGSNFCVGVL